MINETNEIITKIFEQARNGKIIIGDETDGFWSFYTKFCVDIEGKSNSQSKNEILIPIPNYQKFSILVDNYLEKAKIFYDDDRDYFALKMRPFKEKLFLDLMTNMSTGDFFNIEKYIEERTKMIENNLQRETIALGNYQDYPVTAVIRKNQSNFESPMRFQIIFTEENNGTFVLPAILFGIADNHATVFGVQNLVQKSNNSVSKKLDRYFRKVNKDIDSEDIIANISPNALVSFTMFIEYLKTKGVTSLEVKDFFPIRYASTENAIKFQTGDDKQKFAEREQKHDRDQFNMTNKLMYLALRYGQHFPESKVEFDENLSVMKLDLSQKTKTAGENIIYDIANFYHENVKNAPEILKK